MKMSPLAQKFVVHFGEMGGRWGINRTSAQVFALLYLSAAPMHAGDICDSLNFSRSHISVALKELERWRLIKMMHLPGDRRDHFTAAEDVWEIARTLLEERRRREIAPTQQMLEEALAMRPKTAAERRMHDKVRQMHELLTTLNEWYEDMRTMETRQIVRLLKLGSNVASLYAKTGALSDKLRGKRGAKPK